MSCYLLLVQEGYLTGQNEQLDKRLQELWDVLERRITFDNENWNLTEDGNETWPYNPSDVERVLEYLGLTKYFPQKMTLRDVLTLTPDSIENPKPKHPHDIPWYFLRSLTILNTAARENAVTLPDNAPRLDKSEPACSSSDVLDDLWSDEEPMESL